VAANVILPSLGFDMTEGTLSRWLKKEGDRVKKGEAIAEIETEKATVEIEANVSGVLRGISAQAGQTVPVGTVIATIAEEGEKPQGAGSPAPPPEGTFAAPAQAPSPGRPEAPREAARTPEAETGPGGERIKASPVARRMARDAGIDLGGIQGSGPDGRVMERDVRTAMEAKPPVPAEAARPGEATPAPGSPLRLSRMRQAIARRMAESKATAPHFYATVEINMTEAMNVREQLNRFASEAEKISVNDMIVAAVAKALAAFPALNSSYRDGSLVGHSQINIGIAVALEDGLVSPVLRDADRKPLKAIAVESKALSERARAGKLRPDDLGFGTFTISNLGMFDVDEFIAIINPPEAAILAVGAVAPRPVAVGGEVRVAPQMKATLSVDHRVADGAQAGRFLREVRRRLENPVTLLAE
jgi:pyruvate dehydrogenase E2 component (dihydrolipoamide acetyltransferase)